MGLQSTNADEGSPVGYFHESGASLRAQSRFYGRVSRGWRRNVWLETCGEVDNAWGAMRGVGRALST